MKFILGKKLAMSQIFRGDEAIPVTVVKAGKCRIIQIRDSQKDGYQAVQIGFAEKNKQTKAVRGHLKGLGNFRYLREFRLKNAKSADDFKIGDEINVAVFKSGDKVEVTGNSKGKGFQGVVRRHGFHGSPKTHGHKDQLRMPGSIGATEPARVFKGTRMAGRMGQDQITVKNLEIIEIDEANDLLKIKGAIPGARGTLLLISGEGVMEIKRETLVAAGQEAKTNAIDSTPQKDEEKAENLTVDKKE